MDNNLEPQILILIRWRMIPAYCAVTAHSLRLAGTATSASHRFYNSSFQNGGENRRNNLILSFQRGGNQEGRGNLPETVNPKVK